MEGISLLSIFPELLTEIDTDLIVQKFLQIRLSFLTKG